nr:hypothetical protein GCM10017611_66190 [Rhodococcus wratislaviensis]
MERRGDGQYERALDLIGIEPAGCADAMQRQAVDGAEVHGSLGVVAGPERLGPFVSDPGERVALNRLQHWGRRGERPIDRTGR